MTILSTKLDLILADIFIRKIASFYVIILCNNLRISEFNVSYLELLSPSPLPVYASHLRGAKVAVQTLHKQSDTCPKYLPAFLDFL